MAFYGQLANKNKKNKGIVGRGTPSILKDVIFLKDTHLVQGNQINQMHEFKVQIILSNPTIRMKFLYVKYVINEITQPSNASIVSIIPSHQKTHSKHLLPLLLLTVRTLSGSRTPVLLTTSEETQVFSIL